MPAEATRFRLKNWSGCARISSMLSAETSPGRKWTIGSRPRRNYRPHGKNAGNGTEDRELRRTQFLLAAGLICCAAFSQAVKPDFSGTWKLNNDKSKDVPADPNYLSTITQTKATIAITTKAEGVTNLLDGTYPVNGKFRIDKQGNKYRYTKASWEGATLVLEITDKDSKKELAKVLFYVRESWTLSPNGKTLFRFRRTAQSAQTTDPAPQKPAITDQKYVFDKQ